LRHDSDQTSLAKGDLVFARCLKRRSASSPRKRGESVPFSMGSFSVEVSQIRGHLIAGSASLAPEN
jgi:hypothetical protein